MRFFSNIHAISWYFFYQITTLMTVQFNKKINLQRTFVTMLNIQFKKWILVYPFDFYFEARL